MVLAGLLQGIQDALQQHSNPGQIGTEAIRYLHNHLKEEHTGDESPEESSAKQERVFGGTNVTVQASSAALQEGAGD